MGKESDLYDPYNTKTIGGDLRLDVDTYENVQDQIHLESVNRKLLELTDLIGRVTNNRSTSGPIPGTQKIIQTTYTSTGDDATFFQPDPGQVWQIVGGDTLTSGGTGAINFSLKDADGVLAFVFRTNVNGQEPIFQDGQNNNIPFPVYITHENFLFANIVTVATSVRASISFIRVR